MSRRTHDDPRPRVRLSLAIGVILWMVLVFGWVVMYGEAYIGPGADSAAFIARLADFQ